MRLSLVLGVIGHQLRLFSLAFLAPIGLAMVDGDPEVAGYFALALAAAASVGTLFTHWFERTKFLHRSEAFLVVAGTWFVVALFAGVPYLLHGFGPVAAFFESMSGLTTTGATILEGADFERLQGNRAFWLWRAMTQWFGGLGVIALFVVILPRLGIAGRQLFFAEASDATSEGISPRVRATASKLWILYTGLTGLLAALLWFSGFEVFDAVVHALTTLSAGGFSPNGESIAGYHNPTAEWILVVFMVISGTSYPLQYRALTVRPSVLWRDGEFLAYLAVCLLGSLGVAYLVSGGGMDLDAIRAGAFQVTSLTSSTGYASVDFAQWGAGALMLLVAVMLIGGCAGSACGGPKVVRYLLTFKFLRRELKQVLHPSAVIPLRYKRELVNAPVIRAVVTLVFLYLAGYLLLGIVLVVLGEADMVTGMSASLACMGNIGPGFGAVGPMANFAGFSDAAQVLLAMAMWLGRLEIVAVLALLHGEVWHTVRWGRSK